MKKLLSLLLSATLVFSCATMTVLGVQNEEKDNLDYTLAEVRDILNSYFQDNDMEYVVGSEEYYEYLLDQLMFHEDEKLSSHPQYELILDYASAYLCEYQDNMTSSIATRSNSLDEIVEIGDDFDKTISEISAKYRIDEETESLASTRAVIPYNYNASKAISYARQWATGRNPNYKSFSSDCANFVSQCLVAGGVPQVRNGFPMKELTNDTKQWFSFKQSNKSFYTTTFVQTRPLATFWILSKSVPTTTVRTKSSAISNVKAGDVVNLKRKSTGIQYHSIIISYKSGNTVKYCGHTHDRKDQLFSSIGSDNEICKEVIL